LGTCPAGPRPHKATRGPTLFDPHPSITFFTPLSYGLLRVPCTPSHTEGVPLEGQGRRGFEKDSSTTRQHQLLRSSANTLSLPAPPCHPPPSHATTSGMCPHPNTHATHTVTQRPRAAKRLPPSQGPWAGLGKEANGCSTLGQCHAASARTPPRSPRRRAPSCPSCEWRGARAKMRCPGCKNGHKFEPSKNLT
jgi:hypothetical protein